MRHTWTVLLVGLLASRTVVAADWTVVFDSETVGTQVVGTQPSVLVASAGEHAERAGAAAREALTASGTVGMVMDTSALGDTTPLSDRGIVDAASAMPVDQVWVVRVFPEGDAETSVITMYATDGQALGAFALSEDGSIARSSGPGRSEELAKASREALEDELIYFDHWVSANSGALVGVVPRGGRYGEALRGGKLYEWTGDDDNLAEYRRRTKNEVMRSVVIGGMSVGAIAAGGALFFAGATTECGSTTCEGRQLRLLLAGTASAGTGAIVGIPLTWILPLATRADPLSRTEREKYAHDYNDELLERRGIAAP